MESVPDAGRHRPLSVYGELTVKEKLAFTVTGTVLFTAPGHRPEDPNQPLKKFVAGAQHGVQLNAVVLLEPVDPVALPDGANDNAAGPEYASEVVTDVAAIRPSFS